MAVESHAADEVSRMNKVQKLAALLIILGPESASGILKHMDEHELEAVTAEMAKITMVAADVQVEILREFTDVAVAATTSLRGGPMYAQNTLEKAVGVFKASN